MKKNENADMIAKNRIVKASEEAIGVPKITFIMKMKKPRNSPPLIERSHRFTVLARIIKGI